jgi:hypothetical protein
MSDPDMPTDDKYATFKLADQIQVTDGYITFKVMDALKDAVVIRRQDLFASPCLDVYARTIAIVAARESDKEVKAELLGIADYFQRQAELAAEEGWKLPDL